MDYKEATKFLAFVVGAVVAMRATVDAYDYVSLRFRAYSRPPGWNYLPSNWSQQGGQVIQAAPGASGAPVVDIAHADVE